MKDSNEHKKFGHICEENRSYSCDKIGNRVEEEKTSAFLRDTKG